MDIMAPQIRTVYDLLRSDKTFLETDKGYSDLTEKAEQPINLPITESLIQPKKVDIEEGQFVPKKETEKKETKVPRKTPTILQKDYVRYPLIFVVSFAFFYVALNYGAVFSKVGSLFPEKELKPETEGQVLGVVTPDYSVWINKYFFQANNPDSLSPNLDFDRDGLTNYQEFLLRTNPTKKDTDNDNYIDGQEILNGYNPLYEGKLTAQQETVIGSFNFENNQNQEINEETSAENQPERKSAEAGQAGGWDLRLINNRISYYAVSTLKQGPAKPSSLPLINYNLDKQAELSIPKLGVKAPVIWSRTPDTFEEDLDNGLVHYPGTSLPGQVGVTYISGHSSNYAWRQSAYNHVFARLNELNPGDEFFINLYRADDSMLTLRYIVYEKNKYKPDDQAQFLGTGDDSVVNLSTCWPLGTTSERYVVSARLTGV